MSESTTTAITFDLDHGETEALLINALSAYADVLDRQAAEQRGGGQARYATDLHRVASEARTLVAAVTDARQKAPRPPVNG